MVKWKMYSQKMPGPLGSQTRVLTLASFCGLSLKSLRSLRIKRIMHAQRGIPHARCTTTKV